jgi:MoaA/NifB/PqqE/SkfB family radical SAM enzyme
MCGIWENQRLYSEGEITVEELDRILADRLFADIQHLNINGGEPSLRDDLPDMVQVAVERLPHLQWITMSSNGLLPDRLVPNVQRLTEICTREGLSFSLGMSVHGTDGTSEQVFGIKGAFDRQLQSLDALQEALAGQSHRVGMHCVITPSNVENLPELLDWSRRRGLDLGFAVGEVRDRFLNVEKADRIEIAQDQMEPVIDFLRQLASDRRLFNPSAYRYHNLVTLLESGRARTMACHYAMGGVCLGPRGELYYCPHSRDLGNCRQRSPYEIYYADENLEYRRSGLERDRCLRCPPYTLNRMEFAKDILKYLRFVAVSPREG